MKKTLESASLEEIVETAKVVASRYRDLTGKPLGITGELGELQAAQLLGLTLAEARQAGYDAVDSDGRRIQIKARCVLPGPSPSQRIGRIRLDHEWDSVALILMDEEYNPLEVYEADRSTVEEELSRPGSKARNERGAMAVSKFKAIGRLRWTASGIS